MTPPQAAYVLDRDELLLIRKRCLLTSDRDCLYFAIQIDFPGEFSPMIDVDSFAIAGSYTSVTSTKP